MRIFLAGVLLSLSTHAFALDCSTIQPQIHCRLITEQNNGAVITSPVHSNEFRQVLYEDHYPDACYAQAAFVKELSAYTHYKWEIQFETRDGLSFVETQVGGSVGPGASYISADIIPTFRYAWPGSISKYHFECELK